MSDIKKFNRPEPDVNVLYDILVAKGTFSDSEQRAIESSNTMYVANENAHLWAKKPAKPADVKAAPALDATSNTTAPLVK